MAEFEAEAAPLVAQPDINEGDAPLTVDPALDPGHVEKAPDAPEQTMADAVKKELDKQAKKEEFFDSKKAEKAEEKTEPPKDEAKPDKDAKPLDDIYRIPEGMTGQHRAAFKRLSDHALELNEKVGAVETQAREAVETLQEYHAIIQETKASPEQMTAMFDYIGMINAGDMERALQVLDIERAELARRLGKAVPGVDLLEGFDDLKQAVEGMQITPEHAAEIARARRVEAEQQSQRHMQSQQQQTQQQAEAERREAMTEIEKWLGEKRSSDIDFAAKDALVSSKLGEILEGLAPKHWLRQLRLYYDALKVEQPRPSPREPQPLRPQGGGGGKAVPSTMFEAIRDGLQRTG